MGQSKKLVWIDHSQLWRRSHLPNPTTEKTMKRIVTPLILAAAVLGLSNCAPQNNMQRDAATGAAAGAVIGGVIGHQSGKTAEGALLGGALGGAGGAAIGNQKDKQYRGY
jgi:uncharacterized protein YcfJ